MEGSIRVAEFGQRLLPPVGAGESNRFIDERENPLLIGGEVRRLVRCGGVVGAALLVGVVVQPAPARARTRNRMTGISKDRLITIDRGYNEYRLLDLSRRSHTFTEAAVVSPSLGFDPCSISRERDNHRTTEDLSPDDIII